MNGIVIPIYKEYNNLSDGELLSLHQLYTVLGKHQIIYLGPEKLNWDPYLKGAGEKNIFPLIKEFNADFFSGLKGYNKLLISLEFYKAFKKNEYVLIYQLDSMIFRDELEYWCDKGYDYIGAPWFKGFSMPDPTNEIIGVGNGGFSLRNVASATRILKRIVLLRKSYNFWVNSSIQKIISFEKIVFNFRKIFKMKQFLSLNDILFLNEGFEDIFWSKIIPAYFSDYSIAPVSDAIKFCFEVNPSLLFEKNDNKLPFGCHAWERYEPEFWRKYIGFYR